jgi:S1-C subfamily serine protease
LEEVGAGGTLVTCPACGIPQVVRARRRKAGPTPPPTPLLEQDLDFDAILKERAAAPPDPAPPAPRPARPATPPPADAPVAAGAGRVAVAEGRPRAAVALGLVALLVLALAGLGWWYFASSSEPTELRVATGGPAGAARRLADAATAGAAGAAATPEPAGSPATPAPAALPEPAAPPPVQEAVAPAPTAEPPATPAPAADARALAEAARASKRAEGEAGPAPTLSTADIVERCEPSIALLKGVTSTGTGFLVGPNLMATAAHVIDGEPMASLEVRFPSAPEGRRGPHRASLLYEDPKRDLAFLAVETDLPPLVLAPRYEYRKGDDVTVIGNPGIGDGVVLENAIARGVMSTRTTLDGQVFYQLSIAINPGNSGGPVIDPGGRVIGVANLKTTEQEALAFSVPVEDVRVALGRLAAQSPGDLARARSRHRLHAAFQGESLLGALFGYGLELQLASRFVRDDPEVPESAGAIDRVLRELADEAYAPFADEARQAGGDPSQPAEVRRKIGELADVTRRMKSAYESGGGGLGLGQIRQLKSAHRGLVEALRDRLGAELPEGLAAAMEDHVEEAPNQAAPAFAGFAPPTPGESLHQWIMERHRAMRPPGLPTPPTFPRGFGGGFGGGFR